MRGAPRLEARRCARRRSRRVQRARRREQAVPPAPRAAPSRGSPPACARRRTRRGGSSARAASKSSSSQAARGSPSRGWPTEPGLSSQRPCREVDLRARRRRGRRPAHRPSRQDRERDVAVADEHERPLGQLEGGARDVGREHVLPDRVARARVEELDAVALAARLERLEERARARRASTPRVQRAAAPRRRRTPRGRARRARRGRGCPTRQIGCAPLHRRAARIRPRPVADEVAEAPERVRLLALDRLQHRLERLPVSVDVGDDGDPHSAKASTLVALAAGWLVAAGSWPDDRAGRPARPGTRRAPLLPGRRARTGARATTASLRWLWVAATLVTLAALGAVRLPRPADRARLSGSGRVGDRRDGRRGHDARRSGSSGCRSASLELWWGRRYGLERDGYVEWAFERGRRSSLEVVGLTIALIVRAAARRRASAGAGGSSPRRCSSSAACCSCSCCRGWRRSARGRRTTRPPPPRIRELAGTRASAARRSGSRRCSDQTTAGERVRDRVGPSARVVIWDTLLDGRFSHAARSSVVAAHELGHVAHHHIWKGLGWSRCSTVPGLLARRARDPPPRRARAPGGVPLALLVLALDRPR